MIDSQINLICLAEESGTINRFFPSEYGTDIEYFPHSKDEKPHQQKLKVRAYIREHVKRLEYTYLVTGPYADSYIGPTKAAPDAGSFNVLTKEATILGDGEGRVSLTTMAEYVLLSHCDPISLTYSKCWQASRGSPEAPRAVQKLRPQSQLLHDHTKRHLRRICKTDWRRLETNLATST